MHDDHERAGDAGNETSQTLPLAGLVVVDQSQGPAAGLATMVLADFGARVIKLEPPGGDPDRGLASAPMWLRGKQSVVLDSREPAARACMLEQARIADVWVRGLVDDRHAPTDDELLRANPRLVIAWVSAFGRTGPYAAYPAHEALVAAKAGRMLQFRGQTGRTGPVYAALQVATHAASQSLLAGVLAALRARDRDGVGQVIETSLLRGLLPYDVTGLLMRQHDQRLRERGEPLPPPLPDPATALPSLNYHPLCTKDGHWLQMGNLLPHLFMNFVRVAGLTSEFEALGVSGPPAEWPEAARESFRDAMLIRLREKTLHEWQGLFVADGGVASHAYQTTQQALDDEDVVANGHSVPMGANGRQLGVLANLTRTPGRAGGQAPAVGEHTREVLAGLDASATSHQITNAVANPTVIATPSRPRRRPPLDGLLVVEAATVIAAPFGAALLADMGARVIKFEPLEGDPFRNMAPGFGAIRVNTGKESIALDLKRPQAQRIAQAIAARADVFIHNYRPGVPQRLGLGWEQLCAINPRLVYLSANGYGPAGPGAPRPSTHPIPGAALGGVLYQMGGEPDSSSNSLPELREAARRLMRANEVNPDPNTSLVICSAALLALQACQRTGLGQQVFVDMFGANAYANFDDALSYPGKPARALPDRDGCGLNPLWRLYRTAQGWVMFAVGSDAEWARASSLLRAEAALVFDSTFESARDGGQTVADALQRMFMTAGAAQWETRLAPRGVGCVQADAAPPDQFWLEDPFVRDEGLLLPAHYAPWGDHLRHGAQVVFHGTPGVYRGTPTTGEHTDALIAEFGA